MNIKYVGKDHKYIDFNLFLYAIDIIIKQEFVHVYS